MTTGIFLRTDKIFAMLDRRTRASCLPAIYKTGAAHDRSASEQSTSNTSRRRPASTFGCTLRMFCFTWWTRSPGGFRPVRNRRMTKSIGGSWKKYVETKSRNHRGTGERMKLPHRTTARTREGFLCANRIASGPENDSATRTISLLSRS